MTHRERVQGAVERHLARSSPAGFYALNTLFPWITGAGRSVHCGRCSAELLVPNPKDALAYGRGVERAIQPHRNCEVKL